jgi:polyhydroxyalkanoate synthesis regulator phasin
MDTQAAHIAQLNLSNQKLTKKNNDLMQLLETTIVQENEAKIRKAEIQNLRDRVTQLQGEIVKQK